MNTLKGKQVLLTGGSHGLGPFIAEALAREGANVALAARSEKDLDLTASRVKSLGAQSLAIPADLENTTERKRLVELVLERFGVVDVLINNAGLDAMGSYLKLPWQTVRQVVEVNLIAPMELTYLVLPHMIKRKQGHVVNISSVAGKRGAPYGATYSASKAGLAEWTRGLRLELADSGVHFTTIFPGYVIRAGMFAKTGLSPSWLIGSCTPEGVARAVVRGMLRNRLEIIVNSQPLQPILNLGEQFPEFGDWMMKKIGAVDLQRRMAKE